MVFFSWVVLLDYKPGVHVEFRNSKCWLWNFQRMAHIMTAFGRAVTLFLSGDTYQFSIPLLPPKTYTHT